MNFYNNSLICYVLFETTNLMIVCYDVFSVIKFSMLEWWEYALEKMPSEITFLYSICPISIKSKSWINYFVFQVIWHDNCEEKVMITPVCRIASCRFEGKSRLFSSGLCLFRRVPQLISKTMQYIISKIF